MFFSQVIVINIFLKTLPPTIVVRGYIYDTVNLTASIYSAIDILRLFLRVICLKINLLLCNKKHTLLMPWPVIFFTHSHHFSWVIYGAPVTKVSQRFYLPRAGVKK